VIILGVAGAVGNTDKKAPASATSTTHATAPESPTATATAPTPKASPHASATTSASVTVRSTVKVTPSATPTAIRSVKASPTPAKATVPTKASHAAKPVITTTAPVPIRLKPAATTTAAAKSLCGAPANPLGYNFCGGTPVAAPDPSVCSYFACIASFWNGRGYMAECNDGSFSMSGGIQGACSRHGGERRPVDK
jgi:hypothetical protein